MNNLGKYKTLTTVAKKVGGVEKLVAILVGCGIAIGVGSTKACEFGIKKIKECKVKKITPDELKRSMYVVKKQGVSSEGLVFNIGDMFKILEEDNEAILIEKMGNNNNPYFVSCDLLEDISDYREER